MTRLLTYLIVLMTTTLAYGQYDLSWPEYEVEHLAELPYARADVYMHDRMERYFGLAEDEQLRVVHDITSNFARHITFEHVVQGKSVLYSGVKLHIRRSGVTIQHYLADHEVVEMSRDLPYLIPTSAGLVSVSRYEVDDPTHPRYGYVTSDGTILLEMDQYRYFRDTTLHARVHMVNPINTADTVYGGNFVDNQDLTNAKLDSQLRWVQMKVQWDQDTFWLRSQYVEVQEISRPFDGPFIGLTDSFVLDRSMDAFEAVNAYYHINEMGQYVTDLGYGSLAKKIVIDPHAFNGADNSAYDPNNHTIQYGEGGVDDAEDGEVVVHEYIHALSETASPNNTIGKERGAMEEGNCDYIAKAYSRTFNDNTPNKIFSWDGYNPFFSGIKINTGKMYPGDITGVQNWDRDMWSSALMCVHDYIGRLPTDSIVLEHFYYQGPNTTMPQMAQILLDIDSADFNKRYYSPLKQCLVDAGFVYRSASVDVVDKPEILIRNSSAFAAGVGSMNVEIKGELNYEIYTVAGQLLRSGSNRDSIELRPQDFSSGLYILRISVNDREYSVKIVR